MTIQFKSQISSPQICIECTNQQQLNVITSFTVGRETVRSCHDLNSDDHIKSVSRHNITSQQ